MGGTDMPRGEAAPRRGSDGTGQAVVGTGASKADRAYQAILEGIRDQRHEPGDRLVLSQIAAELQMSVVPVREAIRRLQSENLVAYERNVGATVVGIDPVEYRHTMETLALVEGFSTAQCAPHVTAEDIASAREVNAAMRAMTASEQAWDPVAFTELNRRFHSILFEHRQNEHVHDLVHRGWNRLAALRSSTFAYVPGRADASVDEHEQLLRLIEDGAPFEQIEAAARAHRLNTLHAYLEHSAAQST
ncbi:GntR family transcriptional regulator [Micrococcus sp. FDAARGOS_333]|uniref:GntR family transcriptional regulator n=1 Tax=Micrococcus sp. FDAARGOS_333 TaxID=1930558 RepID=UPI001D10F15A|nr:GntR family transcriptional regulator [Micrococcus sp. FDAARGOS_333]